MQYGIANEVSAGLRARKVRHPLTCEDQGLRRRRLTGCHVFESADALCGEDAVELPLVHGVKSEMKRERGGSDNAAQSLEGIADAIFQVRLYLGGCHYQCVGGIDEKSTSNALDHLGRGTG